MLPSTDHRHINRATAYEADGYLLEEDLTAPVLDNAVRRMAASEMILSNRLARTLLTHAQAVNQAAPRKPVLSKRSSRSSNCSWTA